MSAETLALIAGAVLSLAFSYIPGLNTKYAEMAEETKRLIMAGCLLLVAGLAYADACLAWGLFGSSVTCDQAGVLGLVRVFVLALVANQAVYKLTPQTAPVREARSRSGNW